MFSWNAKRFQMRFCCSGWVPACDMYDLHIPCLSMVLRSYVRVGEDMNFPLPQRRGEGGGEVDAEGGGISVIDAKDKGGVDVEVG
jgi:hypothetical protein